MSNARDLADLGKSAEAIDVDASAPADSLNIDSSGNVLVGKTASGTTTAGFEARANGQTVATIDGGTALIANRKTSDGDIIKVMKDGSTVGSIGTEGGVPKLYVGQGDTGIAFNSSVDAVYPFNTSTPTTRDAAIDLGYPSIRFKDLYLSGGVYVGGTGSANYLDDYEEGTWTPGVQSSGGTSLTVSNSSGIYTKIGRFVMVTLRMDITSSGSGISSGACVTGLPFTAYSNLNPTTSFDFTNMNGTLTNSNAFSSGTQFGYFIDGGESKIRLAYFTQGNIYEIPTNTLSGDEGLRLTAYYFTS